MTMIRSSIIAGLLLMAFATKAQYFQYSQYNYTAQRINPAMVASSNYASADLIYRNQATGGETGLKSSMVSAAYPFVNRRNGKRWSGVGISLMDDRALDLFLTQEFGLAYAINITPARYQTLSIGFKGLYQTKRINLEGLFTGSQYIPDRGFDESLANGENLAMLRSEFFTFSSGIYWEQTDREENRLAYWGISLFDFNKPQDSFSGVESDLSSTLIFTGGIRVYEHNKISVSPEVLFTRSASNNVINVGTTTSYVMQPLSAEFPARIDFLTKYVLGRSGILGVQLHRENFSVGFSYDFPVIGQNPGNQNAFEIALQLRTLVDQRLRKKANPKMKPAQTQKQAIKKPVDKKLTAAKNAGISKPKASPDSVSVSVKPKPDLKTTLRHKQDSARAVAEAGKIQHQPLVIEKVTLHFNFEFNSSDLDGESLQYLNDLGTALLENEHLKVKLTGHTDNVGSDKFNQRLSLYRANAIKEHLTKKGIDPARIQTEGKGLTEPLNGNKNEKEMAKNRRVELIVFFAD
jgi:type IX secretion system PorP/SprF family membrane protein